MVTQSESPASTVSRADAVFQRALVLADADADLALSTIDLSRAAGRDEEVLDRARALAVALLHADPHNRGALGAVVLLGTAVRRIRGRH